MLNVVLDAPEERLSDDKLITAQKSVALPEVQEMIRKLSAYNLGVFMPHIHDAEGFFHAAPEGVIAVEDELTVSFANEEDLVSKQENMIPVAWVWRDDGVFVGATCKQVCLDMPVYPPGGPRQHKRTHNQGY
jgi:hypothetical protein